MFSNHFSDLSATFITFEHGNSSLLPLPPPPPPQPLVIDLPPLPLRRPIPLNRSAISKLVLSGMWNSGFPHLICGGIAVFREDWNFGEFSFRESRNGIFIEEKEEFGDRWKIASHSTTTNTNIGCSGDSEESFKRNVKGSAEDPQCRKWIDFRSRPRLKGLFDGVSVF